MSIEQRRHIRFSLDIPAIRYTKYGEKIETVINQISIGGCLLEADESVSVGDEFRLEIQLPNKNWLPFYCKVLYKMEDLGIGVQFMNITRFEQELLAKIISKSLEISGLPLQVSPFENPSKTKKNRDLNSKEKQIEKEELLEKLFSADN